MKYALRTLFLAAASLGLTAFAAEKAAPAKPAYPLTTCVVSEEKLGSMGQPIEYVYKEAGKADRVVLFCCKHCVKDFEKEPAKYLAKIDAAAKPAPAPAPTHKH